MTKLKWTDTVGAPVTSTEARLELAAVCRLVAREGMATIGGARFATRDPQQHGAYLANPGGMLLEEVSASKLIAVDRDGIRLDDGKGEPDSGALALVLAALEARPSAVAAAQVTTTASCAVASLQGGLAPISQTAFMFHGAIGNHDWKPFTDAHSLRCQIATEMAECPTQLVRGRGLLVTGKTLAQTWKYVFFLDKCCRAQISAMAISSAIGETLTIPPEEVIERTVKQSRAFIEHPRFVADWPSFLDQLDREDTSFRA